LCSIAGFTSKFDLYHDDIIGYEFEDDDDDDVGKNNNNHILDVDETTSAGENLHAQKHQSKHPHYEEPDFDYMSFRNVSTLVENTVYLKCFVKNIGNKTVSWVRHRNINLLTVGTTSYTSDSRFQSIHDSDSDEWILKVRIMREMIISF
jgi:hypothetical protein